MVSRILTFVSCTLFFSFLVILTIIGLTSIIIGFVGLGLYIPTSINYNAYSSNICYIVDHEYDLCHQQNGDPCYSTTWFVEYSVSNSTSVSYIFSTIIQTYEQPIDAIHQLQIYKDQTNHTCYYHKIYAKNVKWNTPTSPTPYLIMMIVGFILTGIYFVVIGIITAYRYRRRSF